jgi:hypothetical protein
MQLLSGKRIEPKSLFFQRTQLWQCNGGYFRDIFNFMTTDER